MHTLAFVVSLLMVGARPAPIDEPSRRSGLQTEAAVGLGTLSVPGEVDWFSMTGFALRSQFAYRFLTNEHLRLGPMLAAALGYSQVGGGSSGSTGSYASLTLGPELEWEMSRYSSLVVSAGPMLAASSAIFLGPEVALAVVQHLPFPGGKSRLGFTFLRATFAPLLAVDAVDAGPGYLAQFTIGITAGVP